MTSNRTPIPYDALPPAAADAIDDLLAQLDLLADESDESRAFYDALAAANIDLDTASATLMQLIIDNFTDTP